MVECIQTSLESLSNKVDLGKSDRLPACFFAARPETFLLRRAAEINVPTRNVSEGFLFGPSLTLLRFGLGLVDLFLPLA